MTGDMRKAKKAFMRALNCAERKGFKLEMDYAEKLFKASQQGGQFPVNLP
jgi:hypothetical protein